MPIEIATGDHLHALLVDLGATADAIADTLRAAGIKGLRQDAYCCPIANWILALTNASGAEVDGLNVGVDVEGRSVSCDPPPAVDDFVIRFDQRGDFSDLVSTAAEVQ